MRQNVLCGCVCILLLCGCESQGPSASPAAQREPTPTAAPPKPARPAEAAPTTAAPVTPAVAPADTPAGAEPPPPTFDEGPLRVEIEAMREMRYRYLDAPERGVPMSCFDMRLRIRGERIADIFRRGNVILTEIVDDTGHSMLDPNSVPERERAALYPVAIPPEARRERGIEVQTPRSRPSARGARRLQCLRGSIRVLLGSDPQKITVFNPLQYAGQTVDDPRLKELGLEVRLVPPEEFDQPPPQQCIVIQVPKRADHVQSITFFDGRLRPMPTQDRPMTTKLGETCTAYCFQRVTFDNEMQMVLDVFGAVQDIELPIEVNNIDLP